MDELLTDEQEVVRAKQWLRENGTFLVAGVVLGLGGLFGWQQWQDYKLEHAGQASLVWEQMRSAIDGDRNNEVAETLATLESDFSDTPYLAQARFAAARMHMDKNKPELGAAQLRLALDETGDNQLRMIAELRLGQILLYQQQFDEALALLSAKGAGAFAGQYYELRGDIYYEMARYAEARDEYNLALVSPAEGVISRQLVSMKLDDATGLLASAEVAVADSEVYSDNDNAAELPVADADSAANE